MTNRIVLSLIVFGIAVIAPAAGAAERFTTKDLAAITPSRAQPPAGTVYVASASAGVFGLKL